MNKSAYIAGYLFDKTSAEWDIKPKQLGKKSPKEFLKGKSISSTTKTDMDAYMDYYKRKPSSNITASNVKSRGAASRSLVPAKRTASKVTMPRYQVSTPAYDVVKDETNFTTRDTGYLAGDRNIGDTVTVFGTDDKAFEITPAIRSTHEVFREGEAGPDFNLAVDYDPAYAEALRKAAAEREKQEDAKRYSKFRNSSNAGRLVN